MRTIGIALGEILAIAMGAGLPLVLIWGPRAFLRALGVPEPPPQASSDSRPLDGGGR